MAESIAETGQLVPLVVTADLEKIGYYALLSGHKRADALRSLGRTEANCQVVDVKDADERLLRLLEANRHHVPTILPPFTQLNQSRTALVHSPFFDEHVNDARNGVSFAEEGEDLIGVTAPQFRQNLGFSLKKQLQKRLDDAVDSLKIRITGVVRLEAPYYHSLLAGYFTSKEFDFLSQSASDDDILSSLDTYKRKEAGQFKRERKRIAMLKSVNADYWENARKLLQKVDVQKQVALAEYVSLRKLVLDQLADSLLVKDDGTAHREKVIHDIIFPQRTDSENHPSINHQLWILDERLESHHYLASDQPIDGGKGDRPDLLIALDRASAFVSEPTQISAGYDRIVLVEFKRALKDLASLPTDELPHRQMMRYVREIIAEKATQSGSGRVIKTTTDVRFYLYAVCEISKALIDRLTGDENFTASPTGDGAFGVMGHGTIYVEYMSFEKLFADAKARNHAFFRRLGLEA